MQAHYGDYAVANLTAALFTPTTKLEETNRKLIGHFRKQCNQLVGRPSTSTQEQADDNSSSNGQGRLVGREMLAITIGIIKLNETF